MIAAVREWMIAVVTATLLLSVLQTLVPEGVMRKTVSLCGGLVLTAVLLQPVLRIEVSHVKADFSDYEFAVEERQRELKEKGNKEFAAIIAEQTASYISDKADQLDAEVTVQVKTRQNASGIPIPAEVELEGKYVEELSRWIETELGIPAERQVWNERKD